MAIFYPAEPPEGAPSSELRVRDALRDLEDRWRVFHQVVWQSRRNGREADGEADFVLLHPARGLLVLEVKGGRVGIEDGEWYSIDRFDKRHRIKNPFVQAKDSKYALLRYLDAKKPSINVPVCHGVVFTNASVNGPLGLAGPREVVIDEGDLSNAHASIERILDHWGQRAALTGETCAELVRSLAPTTTIRSRLGTRLDAINAELLQLTREQLRVFVLLKLVRRALVSGGPGTGKTVIAVERCRQLVEEGYQPLLTCYNALLADRLRGELSDCEGVRVDTFHHLCMSEAARAGLEIPREPSDDWWTYDAANLFTQACVANDLTFDAVVIDEGQDFAPHWFTALQLALSDPDTSPMYAFADTQQALYRSDWALPDEWPSAPLDVNCRSTLPITRKLSLIYGETPLSLGAEGPKPTFLDSSTRQGWFDAVQQLATRLIGDEGIDASRIAVLTTQRSLVSSLRELTTEDDCFVGYGETGIVTETVQRFKGLESDVVLLVLGDADVTDEEQRRLAYVGMSRARTMLFVIGTKAVRSALPWSR